MPLSVPTRRTTGEQRRGSIERWAARASSSMRTACYETGTAGGDENAGLHGKTPFILHCGTGWRTY
eukprot:6198733-Pyramimonas_sp.AAC.1